MPEPKAEQPKPEEETKPDPGPKDKAPGDDALDAEGEACSGAACLTARKGGTGLGTGGGGGGGGGYGQYALHRIGSAAQRDATLRRAVDGSESVRGRRASVVLAISVGSDGRIGQVRLAQSCGDPSVDTAVVEAVRRLGSFRQAPPSGTPVTLRIQPQHPAVQGMRGSDVQANRPRRARSASSLSARPMARPRPSSRRRWP